MRSDRTMWWRHAWWIAVVLGSLLALRPGDTASARGRGAPSSRGDDDAHAPFEQVADAYKTLTSYSDQGQFVVAMTLGGKARPEVRPLRLTFARPNKLDLDTGAVRLISDGKTLTTVVEPLKRYTTVPAPETIGIGTVREGPTGRCSSAARPLRRRSCCSTCSWGPNPTSRSTRWEARSAPRRPAAVGPPPASPTLPDPMAPPSRSTSGRGRTCCFVSTRPRSCSRPSS